MSPEELCRIVERAGELKRQIRDGVVHQSLRHKTLAMIFQLNSTRTRVAFETGMHQLGGHAIFLSPIESHLGRGEPVQDMAKVLSEMVDIVMIRTLEHETVEQFAGAATIPVINAMTNRFHPCQLLADVQTFVECRGPIEGRTVAFVGDGYNMCNSYINAARQFSFHLKIAAPKDHHPDPELLATTDNAELVATARDAVDGADLVVTDVWSSMGHEGQETDRRAAFEDFQVSPALMDEADEDALFMHCLPAHRGEEISHDMLDDPRSVAWTEAGNRLHSQKALLEFLLQG